MQSQQPLDRGEVLLAENSTSYCSLVSPEADFETRASVFRGDPRKHQCRGSLGKEGPYAETADKKSIVKQITRVGPHAPSCGGPWQQQSTVSSERDGAGVLDVPVSLQGLHGGGGCGWGAVLDP